MAGMRVAWLVILAGCREIYGLDDPGLSVDALVTYKVGLDMHVLVGESFWTQHETPDTSWAVTSAPDAKFATDTLWLGDGPSKLTLASYGVNITEAFTVWLEGEIYIRDDATTFMLEADDFAFVDMSLDGQPFSRQLESSANVDAERLLENRSGQWIPTRVGWSQTTGSENFVWMRELLGDSSFAELTETELRQIVAN